MLLWEVVWLLLGMALTLAMEWAVAPSTMSRTATVLWPWPLMALMVLYLDLRLDTSTASPITNGKYTLQPLGWTVTDTVAYALIIVIWKHTTWYIGMFLATILLLYLADGDALASAKRHTCSAWRKEPAIGVWKGNPCGSFPPFLLIGKGKHIQGT